MKLAMTLTMDGLIQALRRTAHDLADALEGGYASAAGEPEDEKLSPQMQGHERRQEDDFTRR
ncbi:MAG TPA: hypothetical protein VGM46_14515 [Mesorhizobium sp.]